MKNGKIISFFNHKGGVGKTTLVHNIASLLADRDCKVLLIDADPQMNLTAAMYGLSNSIEYSTDEDSKWMKNTAKSISLTEYLNAVLKNQPSQKTLFRQEVDLSKGCVDLISGSINLADIEGELYGVVTHRNRFTAHVPHLFEQSIRQKNKEYDFILIDTSPSASSIMNALMIMGSDYFIAPVSPSFFSLQAIDNLSAIFGNWTSLLGEYQTTMGFQGLSFKPKFLGLVVQMAKRFNGGSIKETTGDIGDSATRFSRLAEKWINDLNNSVQKFQEYALARGMSISEEQFKQCFIGATPFIIEKCCDFTPQLRSIAEKAGLPVVKLTQDICNQYKDPHSKVDVTKESGQYRLSLDSIVSSYGRIAEGLMRL